MNKKFLDQPVTKSEFEKAIKHLVTKTEFQAEIKKLATKEDLKGFATKEDLKRFATKKDLEKLAITTDKKIEKLNQKFDWLAAKVMANTEKLELMETKEDANKKFNIIMNRLDGIVKLLEDFRIEMKAMNAAIARMEKKLEGEKDRNDIQDEQLKDHEHRISKLETDLI